MQSRRQRCEQQGQEWDTGAAGGHWLSPFLPPLQGSLCCGDICLARRELNHGNAQTWRHQPALQPLLGCCSHYWGAAATRPRALSPLHPNSCCRRRIPHRPALTPALLCGQTLKGLPKSRARPCPAWINSAGEGGCPRVVSALTAAELAERTSKLYS